MSQSETDTAADVSQLTREELRAIAPQEIVEAKARSDSMPCSTAPTDTTKDAGTRQRNTH